jgi:hypothetical protein
MDGGRLDGGGWLGDGSSVERANDRDQKATVGEGGRWHGGLNR